MPTRCAFLQTATTMDGGSAENAGAVFPPTAMAAGGVSIFQAEYRRVGPSPTTAQADKLVGQGPTLQTRHRSYAQFRGLLSN